MQLLLTYFFKCRIGNNSGSGIGKHSLKEMLLQDQTVLYTVCFIYLSVHRLVLLTWFVSIGRKNT